MSTLPAGVADPGAQGRARVPAPPVAEARGGESDGDAASVRLGAHIRRLRRTRGYTLVQLAGRTGLSHPFLSQLERGLAQPSMTSLRRIAIALESSPIELVAASEAAEGSSSRPPAVELWRAGTATVAEFAEGDARMLAHGDRPFHPLEHRSSNSTPGAFYEHDEDEFAYVLSGSAVAELDGQVIRMQPGDSVYYAGGVRHRWTSPTGEEFRLLVVKQRPRLGVRPPDRGAIGWDPPA